MIISSSPTLRSRSRKGIHTWIHGQNDGSRLPSRQIGVSFTDSLPIVQSGNCRKTTSENNGSPSFMAFFKSLATAGYLFQGGVRPYRVHIFLTCFYQCALRQYHISCSGCSQKLPGAMTHLPLVMSAVHDQVGFDLRKNKVPVHFRTFKISSYAQSCQSVRCSS